MLVRGDEGCRLRQRSGRPGNRRRGQAGQHRRVVIVFRHPVLGPQMQWVLWRGAAPSRNVASVD